MSKPVIKYIELDWGCSLNTGRDLDLQMYYGTSNIRTIRPATQKDVDWARAMGGYVPNGRIASPSQS